MTDIGIRLQEGIQELKLEQQLAPAREAVANALNAGSTGFFKAVEGVKERWAARAEGEKEGEERQAREKRGSPVLPLPSVGLKPFSLLAGRTGSVDSTSAPGTPTQGAFASPSRQSLAGWGAGLGTFLSGKLVRRASSSTDVSGSVGGSPVVSSLELGKGEKSGSLEGVESRGEGRKESESEESVTPMAGEAPWVNVTSPGGTASVATPKAGGFGASSGFGKLGSPTTPRQWGGKGRVEVEEREVEVRVVGLDGHEDGHVSAKEEELKGVERHGHKGDVDSRSILSSRSQEFDEEDAYTGMAL